jgi:hypothetical protein
MGVKSRQYPSHDENDSENSEVDDSDNDSEEDAEQQFLDQERDVYRIYQNVKSDLGSLHPGFGDQLSFAKFTVFVANNSSVLE